MSCDCPRFYVSKTRSYPDHLVPEEEFTKATCFSGAVRIHAPGCAWAAGITGGEYHTRDEHVDARAATDEAMALDYQTLKERKNKE